jgi:antitoxin component of MazEF toxin-antitoxin module
MINMEKKFVRKIITHHNKGYESLVLNIPAKVAYAWNLVGYTNVEIVLNKDNSLLVKPI